MGLNEIATILLMFWFICGAIGCLYIVKTIDLFEEEITLNQFTVYIILIGFGLPYMLFAIWFYRGVLKSINLL